MSVTTVTQFDTTQLDAKYSTSLIKQMLEMDDAKKMFEDYDGELNWFEFIQTFEGYECHKRILTNQLNHLRALHDDYYNKK